MKEATAGRPGAGPIEARLGLTRDEAIDRVLRRLGPWVELESPSRHVEGIVALARRLEAELSAIGGVVEAFDAPGHGRNLRVTFEGDGAARAPILVLGHIDTVHPTGTIASQPFHASGDRAGGPGVHDMKVGIALMVEALARMGERGERPRHPVRLVLTCDEEIGSIASRSLIRESCDGVAAAFVPEPCLPDGGAKTRRKGVGTYQIEVRGRAGHAGIDPKDAVSATAELARQLNAILDLADHAAGTTVNIGLIGGGTASNVVPARASATIDIRFVERAEGDRLDRALRSLRPLDPRASVAVERSEIRPPLVRTPAIAALFENARDIAAGLNVTLTEGLTGGGSDGSLVADWGIPVLDGIGPRGGGAHSDSEHIILSDLPFRLAFYMELLARPLPRSVSTPAGSP